MADSDKELILPLTTDSEMDLIPEPDLTPEEERLPYEQKRLRILLRKCKLINCYNFFDLNYLINILISSHPAVVGEKRDAVVANNEGPNKFYLTWIEDWDKVFLLNHWLTQEITENNIKMIDDVESTIGSLVSAFIDLTGCWQRARVIDAPFQGIITVYFVDSGITMELDTKYLRELPKELAEIPEYTIRCKLADVDFRESNLMDCETKRDFIFDVGKFSFIKCQLMEYDESMQTYSVNLTIEDPHYPHDFNLIVAQRYKIRENLEKQKKMPGLGNLNSDFHFSFMHQTLEVQVPAFFKFQMKGLRMFRITQVESPVDFRVEYIVDTNLPPGAILSQQEMQFYYTNPENLIKHTLITSRPLIGRSYVVNAGSVYGWQRARVIDIQQPILTCNVVQLDTGISMTVSYDALKELHPKFAHTYAMGFRAFLVDIAPYGGATTWSQEARNVFKKMTIGKIFHGIVVKYDISLFSTIVPQMNNSLGLILVEKTIEPHQQSALNSQLCLKGLADSNGIAGGLNLPMPKDTVFEFNEMKHALLEEDSTRDVKELTAETPVVTMSRDNSMNGLARAAWSQKSKVVSMKSTNQTDKTLKNYAHFLSPPIDIRTNLLQIPKEIRDTLTICVVNHVSSPSCFYIQSIEKLTQLKLMMKYIESCVDSNQELLDSEIFDGSEVAVFLFDEKERPTWYRGLVRTAFHSIGLAKVILVDYGNEVSVKFSSMRHLPKYFGTIPGFAQRIHLDVQNMVPVGGRSCPGWSTDATETFRKYLSVWQADNPIYYLWRQPGTSIVELDQYGQELSFDYDSGTWKKRNQLNPMREAETNPQKFDSKSPLLMNLCRSIGVDIVYETITSPDHGYKFERAWEILIQQGLAMIKTV